MKRRIFSIILCACFLLSAGGAEALQINVDPPRAEITVKPGEEYSGYITIDNNDETAELHVKSYVEDLVYLPDGSNDFLPPNSTPWSMADWIKVGPTEFDVKPGTEQLVRYIISVPKDAEGGRYGVIFFEVALPPSEFKKAGANVNLRLGTILLVTVDGTVKRKASIQKLSVAPDPEKGVTAVSYTVSNSSNVLIRPVGTAKIIDAAQAAVSELELNKEKGGILPNTNRTFEVKFDKKLTSGSYIAQVVLDYGTDALLGGQKKFEVK